MRCSSLCERIAHVRLGVRQEMFMRWGKYKLMPTFKEKFPGKIMIPCCDNAPYHHNRGVPSLSGIGKKADLIELMRNGTPGATTDNGGFTDMHWDSISDLTHR